MSSEINNCPQNQCAFNGICVGTTNDIGCQNCEECGCKPNMIDNNCDRCLSCSREEGDLRWGNPTYNKEVEVEIKPMEISDGNR